MNMTAAELAARHTDTAKTVAHPATVAHLAPTMTIGNLITWYRAHSTALDRLTGGTRATLNAQDRHRRSLDIITAEITKRCDGDTVIGDLTAEDSLRPRLAEARRLGQDRPELKDRMRRLRARINEVIAYAATVTD